MRTFKNILARILSRIWRYKIRFRIDRKEIICKIVVLEKPRRILEIGSRNGTLAKRILDLCQRNSIETEYTGIDLFSDLINQEIHDLEVSQWPNNLEDLKVELTSKFPNFSIRLLKGFSVEVLEEIKNEKFDLIIIDGGHSFETVLSDWIKSSKLLTDNGSIVFDDYTNNTGYLKGGIGVKRVIDDYIDFRIWEITKKSSKDIFVHDWGFLVTQMVQVKKIKQEV
jgi:predicted O-methyltransferase YrrM